MANRVRRTTHFSQNELQCRCGTDRCEDQGMNADFMEVLEQLRELHGQGMIVKSAMRCVHHCIEAKKIAAGGQGGAHTKGCAVDISVKNSADRYQILKHAFALKFDGIGVNAKFIHLDKFANLEKRAGKPRTWTY